MLGLAGNAAGQRLPLVTRLGSRTHRSWLVALPGEEPAEMELARAAEVTRALLTCRRRVWPAPKPFGPRDMVAERLQLHLRAMEAQLRPAVPIETLHPEVTSDLGRDWSGRYQPSP